MQCKKDHKSHELLTLADKYKKLRKYLKDFLRDSSKCILVLEGKHEVVKNDAKEVKERFRSQYQIIQQRLFEVYKQRTGEIDSEMQKELSRLDNTRNQLKDNRRKIKKTALGSIRFR